MEITKSKALEYYDKWQSSKNRLQKFAKDNEERIEGVLSTVETVGGALAISWVNGKYGKGGAAVQVMGFDADLVLGGAMLALGLFEAGGKYNEHLYSLGSGFLSAYATREGWQLGAKAAAGAPQMTGQAQRAVAGTAPAGSYVYAGR